MPRFDARCTACGDEREITVPGGTHPPCVRCGGATEYVWYRSASVIGDDIPGGQVIENLGHEPMTFYSKRAIVEEAARRGLRLRDQWAGEHDQYLSNWAAAITQTTLDNARILLERSAQRRGDDRPDPAHLETVRTSIREVLL